MIHNIVSCCSCNSTSTVKTDFPHVRISKLFIFACVHCCWYTRSISSSLRSQVVASVSSPMEVMRGIGLQLSSSSAVSVSSSSSFGISVKNTASGQHSLSSISVFMSGRGSADEEETDDTVFFLFDCKRSLPVSATGHILISF